MYMKKQESRIVIISGGSLGLGKELVELFLANGDTVVSLSRTNPSEFSGHIACDISDSASIKAAVTEIGSKYGKIDILINNAGIGISGVTECLPDDEIVKVMDIDYMGALRLSREVLPFMQKGSKIVNVSSACALFALPYRGVYCSAKAAMNMLGYSMRMELSRYGIPVVTICPGEIKTEFTANRLKFDATNERYGDSPRLSAEAIDKNNDKRMPAKKAAKKIFKIANQKKGTLYIVGTKYKVFYAAQKCLPTGMFNSIINKIFNKK